MWGADSQQPQETQHFHENNLSIWRLDQTEPNIDRSNSSLVDYLDDLAIWQMLFDKSDRGSVEGVDHLTTLTVR